MLLLITTTQEYALKGLVLAHNFYASLTLVTINSYPMQFYSNLNEVFLSPTTVSQLNLGQIRSLSH